PARLGQVVAIAEMVGFIARLQARHRQVGALGRLPGESQPSHADLAVVGILVVDGAVAVVGEVYVATRLATEDAGAEAQLVRNDGAAERDTRFVGGIAAFRIHVLRAAIRGVVREAGTRLDVADG